MSGEFSDGRTRTSALAVHRNPLFPSLAPSLSPSLPPSRLQLLLRSRHSPKFTRTPTPSSVRPTVLHSSRHSGFFQSASETATHISYFRRSLIRRASFSLSQSASPAVAPFLMIGDHLTKCAKSATSAKRGERERESDRTAF